MPSLPPSDFRLRTLKCLASHAKTQLLNPSRRISEIAYDVGFQSLTQFNRMFKRIFGQSPTEFRAKVHSRPRKAKAA